VFYKENNMVWGMAQVVEYSPNNLKALSSIPGIIIKRK
jgi:hypothetical protein